MLFVFACCALSAKEECVDLLNYSTVDCNSNNSAHVDSRRIDIYSNRRHYMRMREEYTRVSVYCSFSFLFGCVKYECDDCEIISAAGKRCSFAATRQQLLVKGEKGDLCARRACNPTYAIVIGVLCAIALLAFLCLCVFMHARRKRMRDVVVDNIEEKD